MGAFAISAERTASALREAHDHQQAMVDLAPALESGLDGAAEAARKLGGNTGLASGPSGFRQRAAGEQALVADQPSGPTQVLLVDPAGRPLDLAGGAGSGPGGGGSVRSAQAASTAPGAFLPPYAATGYPYWVKGPDGTLVQIGPDGFPLGGGRGLYGEASPGTRSGAGAAGQAGGDQSGSGGTGTPAATSRPSQSNAGGFSPYAAFGYPYWVTGADGKPLQIGADGYPLGGPRGLFGEASPGTRPQGQGGSAPSGAASSGAPSHASATRTGTPPFSALGYPYWAYGPDGKLVQIGPDGWPIVGNRGLFGEPAPSESTSAGARPPALPPPPTLPFVHGPGFDSKGNIVQIQSPGVAASAASPSGSSGNSSSSAASTVTAGDQAVKNAADGTTAAVVALTTYIRTALPPDQGLVSRRAGL